MSLVLKDTGWYKSDCSSGWTRRVGFIDMYYYRSQQKPARYEAVITAGPFDPIHKEFKSSGSSRKFCDQLIKTLDQLMILRDLKRT